MKSQFREVCVEQILTASNERFFQSVRALEPDLQQHTSLQVLMDSLSTKESHYAEDERTLRALLRNHNQRPHPLWDLLGCYFFSGALCSRGPTSKRDAAEDDRFQEAVLAFLRAMRCETSIDGRRVAGHIIWKVKEVAKRTRKRVANEEARVKAVAQTSNTQGRLAYGCAGHIAPQKTERIDRKGFESVYAHLRNTVGIESRIVALILATRAESQSLTNYLRRRFNACDAAIHRVLKARIEKFVKRLFEDVAKVYGGAEELGDADFRLFDDNSRRFNTQRQLACELDALDSLNAQALAAADLNGRRVTVSLEEFSASCLRVRAEIQRRQRLDTLDSTKREGNQSADSRVATSPDVERAWAHLQLYGRTRREATDIQIPIWAAMPWANPGTLGLVSAELAADRGWTLLQAALSASTGTPYIGMPAGTSGRVLYVTASDKAERVRRALESAGRALSLTPSQLSLARENISLLMVNSVEALEDTMHRLPAIVETADEPFGLVAIDLPWEQMPSNIGVFENVYAAALSCRTAAVEGRIPTTILGVPTDRSSVAALDDVWAAHVANAHVGLGSIFPLKLSMKFTGKACRGAKSIPLRPDLKFRGALHRVTD